MRSEIGPIAYTGSVFLTKALRDSDAQIRTVRCESFASIERRLGLESGALQKLVDRGGVDGAHWHHGCGWVPVPVRFLRVGEKPRWLYGG